MRLRGGDALHSPFSSLSSGTCFSFVDVSDSKGPRKIEWSDKAPLWRMCNPGLSFEGLCKNTLCQAYQKEVIINMGYTSYHFGESVEDTDCPICKHHVNVTTCAFNNCVWRSIGVKILPSGKLFRDKGNLITCGNSYYRFDPNVNGKVEWTRLAIECRESAESSQIVPPASYFVEMLKEAVAKISVNMILIAF
jgi:hypothetical protein